MEVVVGPLLRLLVSIVNLYIWVVAAAVILSWLTSFNVINTRNRAVYVVMSFIYRVTEPLLLPIRRWMPDLGGFDVSPVILIFTLVLLSDILAEVHYKLVH